MTLPRFDAFVKLWKKHPPAQYLLEAAVSWKPKDAPKEQEFDDFGGLVGMLSGTAGFEVDIKKEQG